MKDKRITFRLNKTTHTGARKKEKETAIDIIDVCITEEMLDQRSWMLETIIDRRERERERDKLKCGWEVSHGQFGSRRRNGKVSMR